MLSILDFYDVPVGAKYVVGSTAGEPKRIFTEWWDMLEAHYGSETEIPEHFELLTIFDKSGKIIVVLQVEIRVNDETDLVTDQI